MSDQPDDPRPHHEPEERLGREPRQRLRVDRSGGRGDVEAAPDDEREPELDARRTSVRGARLARDRCAHTVTIAMSAQSATRSIGAL